MVLLVSGQSVSRSNTLVETEIPQHLLGGSALTGRDIRWSPWFPHGFPLVQSLIAMKSDTQRGLLVTFTVAPPAGQSYTSAENILTSVRWSHTTFATDFHVSQPINPTAFDDCLTSPVSALRDWCGDDGNISTMLWWIVMRNILVPLRKISRNLLWLVILYHSQVKISVCLILWFMMEYLQKWKHPQQPQLY